MAYLVDGKKAYESEELDSDSIKALQDETRLEIMKILGRKNSYPADVAKKLNISSQKAYYHFNVLEQQGLIEESHEERRSGGVATFYKPKTEAVSLKIGGSELEISSLEDKEIKDILDPVISHGELEGSIVVGSPREHGPDQVRALDGHLSAEIALKIGSYADTEHVIKLDTQIQNTQSFNQNMIILGGILTNTVTKKFNEEFLASFEGENFPYRKIKTPENSYADSKIGVVQKTPNPLDNDKFLILVAGVRNSGTRASVEAFKDLEQIIESEKPEKFYIIVEGKDMDGDGKIDSYEVLEKHE